MISYGETILKEYNQGVNCPLCGRVPMVYIIKRFGVEEMSHYMQCESCKHTQKIKPVQEILLLRSEIKNIKESQELRVYSVETKEQKNCAKIFKKIPGGYFYEYMESELKKERTRAKRLNEKTQKKLKSVTRENVMMKKEIEKLKCDSISNYKIIGFKLKLK